MNTGPYPVQEEPSERFESKPRSGPAYVSGPHRVGPAGGRRADDIHAHGVVAAQRSEALNRLLNVVIALLSLIVLGPVMVLIALAVKLTSRGPVFYVQDRVGVDRRRRSLAPGAAGNSLLNIRKRSSSELLTMRRRCLSQSTGTVQRP